MFSYNLKIIIYYIMLKLFYRKSLKQIKNNKINKYDFSIEKKSKDNLFSNKRKEHEIKEEDNFLKKADINHQLDSNLLQRTNSYIEDLVNQNKNSFQDTNHNNEFNEFLSNLESLMLSTEKYRTDLVNSMLKLNNSVITGYKPLNNIHDIYVKFTNRNGFSSELLTEALKNTSYSFLKRKISSEPTYYDYSDYELINSRKIYNLVDDLKYGITQSYSFMKYSQITECLKSLRLIGYKNTELLELILQRVNYDLENMNFSDFNKQLLHIPYEIFEVNNFSQSYYEKYGFWPGEGKMNYHHPYSQRLEFINKTTFQTNVKKLMKIQTKEEPVQKEENTPLTQKEEEDYDNLESDIKNILNSLKDIKEKELMVVNSVQNIVEQYEKIKLALLKNPDLYKSSVQLRYEVTVLQSKLTELGVINADEGYKNKQELLLYTIGLLKEFSVFFFNDLFNMEIEIFSHKIKKLEASEIKVSNNVHQSIQDLSNLIEEIDSYSKMNYRDVNGDDYFNKKYFTSLSDNVETMKLTDSSSSTISSSISYDWFTNYKRIISDQLIDKIIKHTNEKNYIENHSSILRLCETLNIDKSKYLNISAFNSVDMRKVESDLLVSLDSLLNNDDLAEDKSNILSNIINNIETIALNSVSDSTLNLTRTCEYLFKNIDGKSNRIENLIKLLCITSINNTEESKLLERSLIAEVNSTLDIEVYLKAIVKEDKKIAVELKYLKEYVKTSYLKSVLNFIPIDKEEGKDILKENLLSFFKATSKGDVVDLTSIVNFEHNGIFDLAVGFYGSTIGIIFDSNNSIYKHYDNLLKSVNIVVLNISDFMTFNAKEDIIVPTSNLTNIQDILATKINNDEVKQSYQKSNDLFSQISLFINRILELSNNNNSQKYDLTMKLLYSLIKEIKNIYNSLSNSMLAESIVTLQSISNKLKLENNQELQNIINELSLYILSLKVLIDQKEQRKTIENNVFASKRLGVTKINTKPNNNLSIELINNKFLWFDRYSPYSDWNNDIENVYDKLNFREINSQNRYYFNNHSKGDRFVSSGIFPNPNYIRRFKSLDASKENSTEIIINPDLRMKVNILNIIHEMKSKLTNEDILTFLSKLTFINKLKLEHIDYYTKEKQIKNDEKSTNLKYLIRSNDSFTSFLSELELKDPRIDDFTKELLKEEENNNSFLRYSPELDYKEREDYLTNKYEKWLELNTDSDNVTESNNKVYFKIDATQAKNNLISIKQEISQKIINIQNSSKNDNFLFEKRQESERNLILLSILIKQTNGLSDEKDKTYLELLKKSDYRLKDTLTNISIGNLDEEDFYSFSSLGENNNINLIDESIKEYSLNELIFELNNFIDSSQLIKKFNFSNEVNSSEVSYQTDKYNSYVLLKDLESKWKSSVKLSQLEIQLLIDMFFVNKNLTKFEISWLTAYKDYLHKEINELNEYHDRYDLINSLIRLTDREYYDKIFWSTENTHSSISYNKIKADQLKEVIEQKAQCTIEELQENKEKLNKFINSICENIQINKIESFKLIESVRLNLYDKLSSSQKDLIESFDSKFNITESIKKTLREKFSKLNKEEFLIYDKERDIKRSYKRLESFPTTKHQFGTKDFELNDKI